MAKSKQSKTNQQQQRKKQQPKQAKQNRSVVVHAPTSLSVRRTTPSSGDQQTIQLFEVKQGLKQFDILPAALPWLQGIAPSYQRWKLSNVRIWYEPRVSTATNGTVAMAFHSDFMDGTPLDLTSLSLSGGSVRSAVWDRCSLPVRQSQVKEYCSLSSFNALSPQDKNERAFGRVFAWGDLDSDIVAGRVFMSYTPHLSGPVDPKTQ
ncbi:coat protein [Erysiphe necator associated tombus-like virus 4]|nr:coat protein [Erysiphe necator associated tombus-like virus 4]